MPPAARTGTSRASSRRWRSGRVPTSPVWPPASVPWATIRSTPASTAAMAVGRSWAWEAMTMPASCSGRRRRQASRTRPTRGGSRRDRRVEQIGTAVESPSHEPDAERQAAVVARHRRLLPDQVDTVGAADPDHAEPSSLGHGPRQAPVSNPGHGRSEDGKADAEALGQHQMQHLGPPKSRLPYPGRTTEEPVACGAATP